MQTPLQTSGLLQMNQASQNAPAESDDALQAQYVDAYEYVEKLSVHPQAVEQIANMIADKDNLAAGIAEAAAFIMVRVEAHRTLDDEVKLELIGDVLEVAFEIAGEMGLVQEAEVDDALVQEVMQLATVRYAEMKEQAGMPADLAHAREGLNEIEQSGTLSEAKSYFGEQGAALDTMVQLARQGGQ